jgi:single-stranded DNA-binding protein
VAGANDGFFRCTAGRSIAENAARTLKKGMRVFVAGKLVQRSWQDDDGNKRQTVEIQVTHVEPDVQFRRPRRSPSPPQGFRFALGRSFGCVLGRGEAEE